MAIGLMSTTKFTITADIPDRGKVQHIIREASEQAARDKLARIYPGKDVTVVRVLRDGVVGRGSSPRG